MEKLKNTENLAISMAFIAIVISLISLWQSSVQFKEQDQSDLLANCGFNRESEAFFVNETAEASTLKVKTKCLIQNNGRKVASIIKVRSIETFDGKPAGRRIEPIALYKNDLIDSFKTPIASIPGETLEIDVWLRIYLDPLNKGKKYKSVINDCNSQSSALKTYGDIDSCLNSGGFFISDFMHSEPYPLANIGHGSQYNGAGVQLFTNDNMAATYEVNIQRVSSYLIGNEDSKDPHEKSSPFSSFGLYLEEGFREKLGEWN